MSCLSGKVVEEVAGRGVLQVLLRLGAREGRQAVEARLLGMSLPFRSTGV